MSLHRRPIPPPSTADNDSDDDICPVCDRECTCPPAPHRRLHPAPAPLRPPLKIKLTLRPPSKPTAAAAAAVPPLNRPHHPHSFPSKKRKRTRDSPDLPPRPAHFPTFVSASILSDHPTSSSASSSGDDDDDSFVHGPQINDRRHRDSSKKRNRDFHNAWIIPSRKKSDGSTDAGMDIDSDVGKEEDDDEDDEDEDGGDDDDDPAQEHEDDQDDQPSPFAVGPGYVGFATGWSDDDEESSFDADLFFANLSSSPEEDDDDAASGRPDDADDADQSDFTSTMEASITSLTSLRPLQFEVTESWDGGITFTNGLHDGQGVLDIDFEADAARYRDATPCPPSPLSPCRPYVGNDDDADASMSDDDVDDGGYEEDTGEGDGDTTDEELVGDDDLPNERAMRLFNLPWTLSAINPLSTMNLGPKVPIPNPVGLSSPRRVDGRVMSWDSDDYDERLDRRYRCSSWSGPKQGRFELPTEVRVVVIDGDQDKEIPSPHPRFKRRKPPAEESKLGTIQSMLQRDLLDSPTSAPAAVVASNTVSLRPLASLSAAAETPAVSATSGLEIDMVMPELVDLNELLEASILAPDTSSDAHMSTDSETRTKAPSKNFHRWDFVSLGTFPSTSSPCSSPLPLPPSSPPSMSKAGRSSPDYRSIMKASPLSTMMWSNRKTSSKAARAAARRKPSLVISPVILPVGSSVERTTPTSMGQHHQYQYQIHRQDGAHKSRKELRREKKLKKKSFTPFSQQQHHQYHIHHHHPNLKSRATGSLQRNNFFVTSIPPLSL